MKEKTLIDPSQIEATRDGYQNLQEQLEYGRFHSTKSGAAPTLYHEVLAEEGQMKFILPKGSFTKGDHSLQVYVNGQLMREGIENDYIELDNQSVLFNFALTSSDVVVMRVNGGTSGAALHENVRAKAGQTAFELIGSYMPGNASLIVYVNGAYQTIYVDYEETDAKTVTFIEPMEEGDLITFRVEGLQTIISKYSNSEVVTTFDKNERIVKEEIFGSAHILKLYEYDQEGLPFKMTIRESGFIVTKLYTWEGRQCIGIETITEEGS